MTFLAAHVADAANSGGGGFNLGTLLMFVGGALLLAFVSSIGIIARIRDNRLREADDRLRQSRAEPGAPTQSAPPAD